MKRKFYSWDECLNLREVKVRSKTGNLHIWQCDHFKPPVFLLVKSYPCFSNIPPSTVSVIKTFCGIIDIWVEKAQFRRCVQTFEVLYLHDELILNDSVVCVSQILCVISHWRSWTMPMWWNWGKSSEKMTTSTLSLSIWKKTSISSWKRGRQHNITIHLFSSCEHIVISVM